MSCRPLQPLSFRTICFYGTRLFDESVSACFNERSEILSFVPLLCLFLKHLTSFRPILLLFYYILLTLALFISNSLFFVEFFLVDMLEFGTRDDTNDYIVNLVFKLC